MGHMEVTYRNLFLPPMLFYISYSILLVAGEAIEVHHNYYTSPQRPHHMLSPSKGSYFYSYINLLPFSNLPLSVRLVLIVIQDSPPPRSGKDPAQL